MLSNILNLFDSQHLAGQVLYKNFLKLQQRKREENAKAEKHMLVYDLWGIRLIKFCVFTNTKIAV